jgi:hypothetical protein
MELAVVHRYVPCLQACVQVVFSELRIAPAPHKGRCPGR